MLVSGVSALYSSMARASGRRFDCAFLLYRLTDLLTRLVGTWEMARDADDNRRAKRQVSETHRDAGDVEDARRMAHNPATTASPWLAERAVEGGRQIN